MHFYILRFALASAVVGIFSTAETFNAQKNPPATPQAKTSQPATHFTQGTIASIDAKQLVITRKVRGKTVQMNFAIDSQTQQFGNVAPGARVSVQYREADRQKIVAAIRGLTTDSAVKPGKSAYKPKSKS